MLSAELRDFYNASPMREGVLCWYPFIRNASVLDISNGALTEMLKERCNQVISEGDAEGKQFDYIVLIDPDDYSVETLKKLYKKLSAHGRLLFAYENPFALRYWSGKRSPVTGLPYDSLLGYDGRVSKAEMRNRLGLASFEGQKWYYPLTDHWFAREIYSDSYLPDEYLNQRFKPYIAADPGLTFDERSLYREVIRGGAFEFMCGSYLVEARVCADDEPCAVDYAAVTAYREPSKRFATTVRNDGTVRKVPLHEEGRESLRQILNNHDSLSQLGISMLPVRLENNALVMPRLNLPTLWDYWVHKLLKGELNYDDIARQFDRLRDAIYQASVDGKCYWELVPANCFYDEQEEELIFFDQEFYWEGVTPKVALIRALWAFNYSPVLKADSRTKSLLEKLKLRYNLTQYWDKLTQLAITNTYNEVFSDGAAALETTSKLASKRIIEKNRSLYRRKRYSTVPVKLQNMGYMHPIIYGYGKRGKDLVCTLLSFGTEIAAVVDKESLVFSDLSQVPLKAGADVVIVSVLDSAAIMEKLKDTTPLPLFTLEELLEQ